SFKICYCGSDSLIVASNNVKHEIGIYSLNEEKLLSFPFTKLDPQSEFPYPVIQTEGSLAWFSTSPSILTILDMSSNKVVRKDVNVKDSKQVLKIGASDGLIDMREAKPKDCHIKTLCYVSHLAVIEGIFSF